MTALSLETAERLAKAAVAHARATSMNPISVSVIDASGHLKYALREDGAGIAGIDIAQGKARAALTFGCSSRQISEALAGNPLAGQSVIGVLQNRVALITGGVLVHGQGGEVIGAMGAAGDAPDNDETAVLAATGG